MLAPSREFFTMSLLDHMCPKCQNYMKLMPNSEVEEPLPGDLERMCVTCGYKQAEKKGLVMEVIINEKESDAYKLYVNEHTKDDARYPHVTTLKCPTPSCPSHQPGGKSDVVYIKYDAVNLKFLYICTQCNTQWRSRS
jgi:DNA-directed RNA polymerase subunit M/transcription elongation factor TFIIS